MNNYEHLDIASGIRVNVDTSGITNGSLDVTDIQYDTEGYIGQLNSLINNNNISITEILDILRGIDPTLIEILTQIKNPSQIDFNEVLQLINKSKLDLIKEIYNRVKPIYVDRPVVYTTTKYIEVRTEKTIYVSKPEDVKPPREVRIDWGTERPPGLEPGWTKFGDKLYYKELISGIYIRQYNKEYRLKEWLNLHPGSIDDFFERGWITKSEWKSRKGK
jgi:hypothetical protein